jgi:pyruvate kinase
MVVSGLTHGRPMAPHDLMRRTKIVATIGPSSQDSTTLERLIVAGVNVVRLNFYHGTHEGHGAVIERVREISARLDRPIAILQDLSGPKIRIGDLVGGEPVTLRDGATVTITTDESVPGSDSLLSTTYPALPRDVRPGDRILLDDGNLALKVVAVTGERVQCTVVNGGVLKPRKGMNLPGVALSTPALTEKDRADLAFGVEHGVDYVALSFVRRSQDVRETKALVAQLGGKAAVIAKIEKPEAIADLTGIIAEADGVMVARGDLGVELSTEEVPTLQKRIIAATNGAGKVVITATQMLESMVTSPRPTRAEASDVANAIVDGTDAVMLSAETAAGRFPVEAVETMARIAVYTEEHLAIEPPDKIVGRGSAAALALARVARAVAEELGCRLIVAFTVSGMTAELASTFQPRTPIVALTPRPETLRRLALWWGVAPLLTQEAETTDEMIARGEALLKARGLAAPGDTVLMLAGLSHTAGATNMLRVHTVS